MALIYMNPTPALGSGEIKNRFDPKPQPPLPWYYDQNKSAAVALFAILTLIAVARIFG